MSFISHGTRRLTKLLKNLKTDIDKVINVVCHTSAEQWPFPFRPSSVSGIETERNGGAKTAWNHWNSECKRLCNSANHWPSSPSTWTANSGMFLQVRNGGTSRSADPFRQTTHKILFTSERGAAMRDMKQVRFTSGGLSYRWKHSFTALPTHPRSRSCAEHFRNSTRPKAITTQKRPKTWVGNSDTASRLLLTVSINSTRGTFDWLESFFWSSYVAPRIVVLNFLAKETPWCNPYYCLATQSLSSSFDPSLPFGHVFASVSGFIAQ